MLSRVTMMQLQNPPDTKDERALSVSNTTINRLSYTKLPNNFSENPVKRSFSTSLILPPTFNRQNSIPITTSETQRFFSDWTRQISIDERKSIREKIKAAYIRNISESFTEMLEVCSAVEEELLFSTAPSKLDYMKSGLQYEKRIKRKLNRLISAESKQECDGTLYT